jgi:integrase
MNRRVNILLYVKTPSGLWQWEPIPKNRRTGAYLWSKAKGNQFHLSWREGKRRYYKKAGTTPAEALEAQRRKEFELIGRAVLNDGRKVPRPEQRGMAIEAAVADYLDFVKKKKRPNTLKRYRAVLTHFQTFFRPYTQLATIIPSDIDAFRDERLIQKNPWGGKITARNVNSEVAMIRAFFYYLIKFRDPSLLNPAARLKPLAVTKPVVDVYDEKDLESFFDACNPEELAVFKTFYYTGLRDQELAHLHWSDLNLRKEILTVRAKPEVGFIPKDWEREIPLNPKLVAILKELPHEHEQLVFPSFRGRPNGHLLRMLKRVVARAKLPGRWYLHRFRKTFATRALDLGGDIRTVQELLGHKDIATTARYLGTSTEKMREAVRKL